MISFQYNKTSLQHLEKQLKMRQRTLPIIKNKESALRVEVKKCKNEMVEYDAEYERLMESYKELFALWNDFDASLVRTGDFVIERQKVAGVKVPVLKNVEFVVAPYSMFCTPKWYMDGIELLKQIPKQDRYRKKQNNFQWIPRSHIFCHTKSPPYKNCNPFLLAQTVYRAFFSLNIR